jgi:hypothetical protein
MPLLIVFSATGCSACEWIGQAGANQTDIDVSQLAFASIRLGNFERRNPLALKSLLYYQPTSHRFFVPWKTTSFMLLVDSGRRSLQRKLQNREAAPSGIKTDLSLKESGFISW